MLFACPPHLKARTFLFSDLAPALTHGMPANSLPIMVGMPCSAPARRNAYMSLSIVFVPHQPQLCVSGLLPQME
jgi:hypothetical protein